MNKKTSNYFKRMKKNSSRRDFIKRNSLAGLGTAFAIGSVSNCGGDKPLSEEVIPGETPLKSIGGITFKQLRERYRKDLFGRFLPNMDRFVVDHEYGGFMCNVNIRSGKKISTNKRAWYEGRGIWVYSFLYNNFEQNPEFLEVARKSKDFILKLQPTDGNFWPSSFTREGTPLSGPGDIYGNLFIAEGLAEYAKASGEGQYFELAKKIMFGALARYDRPEYDYSISYGPSAAPKVMGPRVLGHWMVFLRLATQMLEKDPDPDIEDLAERCVDAVMNYHLHPEYGLLNELLTHNLTLPDSEFAQFSYLGHSIETLWMVMFEAVRRKDTALFRASQQAFERHVTVATDPVYGGYFRSLDHVDDYNWKLDKVLWLQEEVLIGTLFLIEHTGDLWAQRCYAETDAFVREKFHHLDFKFWIPNGNRQVSEYNLERVEHYHHPRHLMLNLLAIERFSERKSKTSKLFSKQK